MDRLADIPECTLSIGRKFYPPLSKRGEHLRDADEAAEWASSLDWSNNPYDRFLLKREIVRQSERFWRDKVPMNCWTFASPDEIAGEVDKLLDEYKQEGRTRHIFQLILATLPWTLGYKHGRVQSSRLARV